MLLARTRETAAIDELLAATGRSSGGALVFRSEPGLGKTALLDYAARSGVNMTVIRVAGYDAERDFAYAAVVDVVEQLGSELERLPAADREALSSLGRAGADSGSLLQVSLSVLAALTTLAAATPILCLVDDADQLDRTSSKILGYIARRLQAHPVAMILVTDEPREADPYEGVPALWLAPLSDDDARALLARATTGELSDDVREELVAALGGNPLALTELAGELTASQLAGLTPLPAPLPVGDRLEHHFRQRAARLLPETRRLLLLVAAEPSGEADLIEDAARRLEIGAAAFREATATEIVERRGRLGFRSSFVRAAVWELAPAEDRRQVHRALASVTDAKRHPGRRAWHRAEAAEGADDEIAQELEDAAATERVRGAYSTALPLLERSAHLSSDPADRARRTVEAAELALLAEAVGRASKIIDRLDADEALEATRGTILRLRGKADVALARNQHTAGLLLQAARDLEAGDPRRARDTYLDALMAAVDAGSLIRGGTVQEAARAAAKAPRVAASEKTTADLFLDGFSLVLADRRSRAAPLLRRAVDALWEEHEPRLLTLGCHAAVELFDDEALFRLVTRRVELASTGDAPDTLMPALNDRGGVYAILVGQFDAANRDLQRSHRLAIGSGNPGVAGRANLGRLILAAWRGREAEARELAADVTADAASRGQGAEIGFAQYALAVLCNGLNQSAAALDAARSACEEHASYVLAFAHPELVEAAVRAGEPKLASASIRRLGDAERVSGSELAAGILARSRALVARDRDAERLYRHSIDHLKRCRARPQLARTKLLYGEWLRRQRRRRDAREQLSTAHEMLAGIGADAFARRAQRELLATGVPGPTTNGKSIDELTAHERRIARLVADGASNPEIAAQLFVSVRTVEYHMHKIFRKLEIGSRGDLVRLIIRRE